MERTLCGGKYGIFIIELYLYYELLFSNPNTTKGRHDITIKMSLDGGITWLPEHQFFIANTYSAKF